MSHRAHLEPQETRELRAAIADGIPYRDIAHAYGVSTRTVTAHAVATGRNRRPSEAPPPPADEPHPLAIDDQPWARDAVCAQTDPESFFPEKGGSTREAKAICAGCTVAAECLDYALDNGERFGIWGGLSERERRKVQKALEAEQQPSEQESA